MRKTDSEGFIPELDGLRGIAILLVMVHRVWPRADGSTPWPIEAGWVGVDLFFVISGFLITGILLDTREDPHFFRNFYARRILRIFPLFYLLVGGMLLAFPLLGNHTFIENAGSPLWYLFHLGNVPEALLGNDPPYWLAPVWSLAIEEQFYWTFPLLVAAVAPRRLARWLVGFAALALVTRIVTTITIPDRERVQYLFTLCRLDTIAAGCLLAVLVRWDRYAAIRDRLSRWLGGLALVMGAVLTITQLDRTSLFGRTLGYSIVAIAFASLVLLVVIKRDQRSTAALRWAPLRYLGKICFGLYLLHRPADTIVSAVAAKLHLEHLGLALVPVKIAVAVALATLSWRLLEAPCLRLKRYFSSTSHPAARRKTGGVPASIALAAIVVVVVAGCRPAALSPDTAGDAEVIVDAGTEVYMDAFEVAADAAPLPDGAIDAPARVLYSEDRIQSPITPDIAAALQAIASSASTSASMFSKVGDSITENSYFLTCFGGTANTRNSLAARGGWSTYEVLAGSPSPLDSELAAAKPRTAIIMLGTNDLRAGRSLDLVGSNLWTIVDRVIAAGAVPVLSAIPQLYEWDSAGDSRVYVLNRIVRAIAQGRSIPLVDYHRALDPLANDGISSDGIHPTYYAAGACDMTAQGLQYGYNVRNLTARDALERARRATTGESFDGDGARRTGQGTHAAPFVATLPLVDLADTRRGELAFTTYSCGLTASGHEVVYQLDAASSMTIDVYVVDKDGVDVDIAVLSGAKTSAACVATGDRQAAATVGPGTVYIVVDSKTAANEGEFLLVVQRR